jgi:hypothetical protein
MMMADRKTAQTGVAGSGRLYEHGEAGQKAAEEPVSVPGSADKSTNSGRTTGEEQAAVNREVDPPA